MTKYVCNEKQIILLYIIFLKSYNFLLMIFPFFFLGKYIYIYIFLFCNVLNSIIKEEYYYTNLRVMLIIFYNNIKMKIKNS